MQDWYFAEQLYLLAQLSLHHPSVTKFVKAADSYLVPKTDTWLTCKTHSWKEKHKRLMNIYEPHHDKTNKISVRQVWSESSLSAWRKLGSLATH